MFAYAKSHGRHETNEKMNSFEVCFQLGVPRQQQDKQKLFGCEDLLVSQVCSALNRFSTEFCEIIMSDQ